MCVQREMSNILHSHGQHQTVCVVMKNKIILTADISPVNRVNIFLRILFIFLAGVPQGVPGQYFTYFFLLTYHTPELGSFNVC